MTIESDLKEYKEDIEAGIDSVSDGSTKSRLIMAGSSAALFGLISSPAMYQGLQSVFGKAGFNMVSGSGAPTALGLLTTGIVFTLAVRVAMSFGAKKHHERHDPNGIITPNGGNDPSTGGLGQDDDDLEDDSSSKSSKSKDLWMASGVAGFLYLILANPYTYALTDAIAKAIGFRTLAGGNASYAGLGLHSLVYGAVTYFVAK